MNAPILEKIPAHANGQYLIRQTVVLDEEAVHIPSSVVDLATFRKWSDSEEFPQKTPRICYLAGEIWIDMSKEQIFSHNQLKAEISFILTGIIKADHLGRFFPDGVLITNLEAQLSCKPDGVFVSEVSFDKKRVTLVEGAREGFLELEGTPDMVLEVISDSSVEKDTITLRELYHRAGVREYWLVDARDNLLFDILRYTSKGYSVTRKQKGWLKSQVFGKSFQLQQRTDKRGNPEYTLLVK